MSLVCSLWARKLLSSLIAWVWLGGWGLNPRLMELLCFFKWNRRNTHTHTHKMFALVQVFCGRWKWIDFIAFLTDLSAQEKPNFFPFCLCPLTHVFENLKFELFEYFQKLILWIMGEFLFLILENFSNNK